MDTHREGEISREPYMNEPTGDNEKELQTKEQMTRTMTQYLKTCIHCHSCMDVCPVTKGAFTIEQLNDATTQGATVPAVIKEFAWNCVQCGKCVPVCPAKIRRDVMIRFLKYNLRKEKPWSYKRYLLIRGSRLGTFARFIQRLYASAKRAAHRDLASYMEVRPTKAAEVLFYPGCYLYSVDTIRQTIQLLDYLGCSYAVLGGMSTCCGMPHLLQGEFDRADECMKQLHRDITAVHPKTILTSCAECHDAITQIKTTYHEDYEVCSVVEYLVRHQGKFPRMKIREDIIVHDSCRFSSETPAGRAAQQAASNFGTLVGTPSHQRTPCCSHWNHNQDTANIKRRLAYLKDVNTLAPTLACNCLTCYEEFKKLRTDMNVIDVIQLFVEALTTQTPKEQP